MPASTALSFRQVEDTAIEDKSVSPRAESGTDVSRLRAQSPTIVAIVVAAVGLALYIDRNNAEIRSDVKGILSTLASQEKLFDLKLELAKSEMEKGELRKALLERMNPERK